jgi:acetolactate synthase-1/2/3 large subunit
LGRDYSYFARVKEELYARINERAQYDNFPMKPQRFVADVRKAMPSDGIIALDNGMYKLWFARNYLAAEPNTVLLDNALATMRRSSATRWFTWTRRLAPRSRAK